MVKSEIERIFEPIKKKFHFINTIGRFENNYCIKNEQMYIELFHDPRNNEMSILVYKDIAKKGMSILTLIDQIKPNEYNDVFGFLKNEYLELDNSLTTLKDINLGDNRFILLTICSILIKYYDKILDVFESEFLK